MVLFPPLCLEVEIRDGFTQSTPNSWNCIIDIRNGGQATGVSGLTYNGLSLSTGMWIGNGAIGYAFKIINIISRTADTVQCILEDTGDINKAIDPSGEGGGPRSLSTSFIFELVNGLPAMSQVSNYPNITWTDSILGRFISTSTPTTPAGVTGATGPTGLQGIPGSASNTGATGPTGIAGAQYFSRLTGTINIPTENSTITFTGIAGLSYSRGDSILVQRISDETTRFEGIVLSYTRSTGIFEVNNITNIRGINYGVSFVNEFSVNLSGTRGSNWFLDNNNPTGGVGRIGDFYINQITGEVFIKRAI